METIETLRAREIEIREKNQQEKDREFQRNLAQIIIYYCSGFGKGFLPINEKLFLTAVVRGLARVAGIEDVEITPYCLSCQHWREDIEKVLEKSVGKLMEVKDLPNNLYNLLVAVNEIIHIECDNDQTGGRNYRSQMMTTFKNIRDSSGYYGETFEFPQRVSDDIEKNIIPIVNSSNWSALFFIKTLSEKTKWRSEILY